MYVHCNLNNKLRHYFKYDLKKYRNVIEHLRLVHSVLRFCAFVCNAKWMKKLDLTFIINTASESLSPI